MEDLKAIIAANMICLRRAKGYTQAELAEILNYTDKAVSKWERGESVPDIAVLKQIADLFGVTVDYLITPVEEHPKQDPAPLSRRKKDNRRFVTGMSIVLVWLIATFVYVLLTLVNDDATLGWLSFVYAVPATFVVWLIFNAMWFYKKRNFLIISLLMWSVLGTVYLTLLPYNLWLIFVLGVPGQIIIALWSRIRLRSNKEKKERKAKERMERKAQKQAAKALAKQEKEERKNK